MFTQGLSQIEGTLNKVFAERNADRDALAKKYRYVKHKFELLGFFKVLLTEVIRRLVTVL